MYQHIKTDFYCAPADSARIKIDLHNNSIHFRQINYTIVNVFYVFNEGSPFTIYEAEAIRTGRSVVIKRKIEVIEWEDGLNYEVTCSTYSRNTK